MCSVSKNRDGSCVTVCSTSKEVFVARPRLLNFKGHTCRSTKFQYCTRITASNGPLRWNNGIRLVRQLEVSNLFAIVGDGKTLSTRTLRIVSVDDCISNSEAEHNIVGEINFRESIIDVKWIKSKLIVILPRSIEIYLCPDLVLLHRISTRKSGGTDFRSGSVVCVSSFNDLGRHFSKNNRPNASVSKYKALKDACVTDILLIKAAAAKIGAYTFNSNFGLKSYNLTLKIKEINGYLLGSITIVGLTKTQIHMLKATAIHNKEIVKCTFHAGTGRFFASTI